MFVGSFNTAEELEVKLARAQLDLMDEGAFQSALKNEFPRCTNYYNSRTSKSGTSWKLDRVAQTLLFKTLKDNPSILDYALIQMNPQANQELGYEDATRGLRAIEGKRLLEAFNLTPEEVDRMYRV